MADFLDKAEEVWRAGQADKFASSFELVFKGISALRVVHSRATLDIDNIESVFAAFEMANLFGGLTNLDPTEVRELPAAIRGAIVRTLEMKIDFRVAGTSWDDARVIPPACYDNFTMLVADMNARDPNSASVLTFNYDVGVDYGFHWIRQGVDYCLSQTTDSALIPLMKLHGSVNWARCPECHAVVPWGLSAFFSNHNWGPTLEPGQVVRLNIGSLLPQFLHCGKLVMPEPVIVPPTWNKTQHHTEIEGVWQAAARHLAEAENIFVIGYSLPATDEFFRYLYALGTVGGARLKRLWVFDPDATGGVKARFEALLGPTSKSRFQMKDAFFSQAIEIIRRELAVPRQNPQSPNWRAS
jgi:hypothetical protein